MDRMKSSMHWLSLAGTQCNQRKTRGIRSRELTIVHARTTADFLAIPEVAVEGSRANQF